MLEPKRLLELGTLYGLSLCVVLPEGSSDEEIKSLTKICKKHMAVMTERAKLTEVDPALAALSKMPTITFYRHESYDRLAIDTSR